MLLCWVMGIAQRSFMMSPQLAPTQQCRGLLSKGSWNELVLGELALLRPNSWAPAVATCKESPEQSSKSSRGSFFGDIAAKRPDAVVRTRRRDLPHVSFRSTFRPPIAEGASGTPART